MTVLETIASGAKYLDDIAQRAGLDIVTAGERVRVLEREGLVRADHTGTFSTYHLKCTTQGCPVVPLERAQELERERDEAREKLTEALGQAGRWADAYAGEIALRRAADSVARGFDRERDEAVAAARDFAGVLTSAAEWVGAIDGPHEVLDSIAEILDRHPSFLPPDREE